MLSSISASDHNLPTGLVAFSPCDHSSLHDPLSGQIQIFRHEVSGLRAGDASSWAVCLWGREQQQGWRWFEIYACSSHTPSICVDFICLVGLQQPELPAFSPQASSE